MKLNLKLLGVGSSYCKRALSAFCFLLLAGGVGAQSYSISTGDDFGAVIDDTGNLYVWGALQDNGGGLSQVLPSGVWQSVSVSKTAGVDAHILAIRTDGTLWAWGSNDRGQLGAGDQVDRVDPVQISSASNWVEVAAGAQHSLARNNGNKVFAWGDNTFGQLNATPIYNDPARDLKTSIPAQPIDPFNDYISIAAGNHHSHAIRADGTLWAWGSGGSEGNGGPELGLPGGGSLPYPVGPVALTQVGTGSGWTRLFGGYQVTYALRYATGQLWAWGAGGFIGTGAQSNILSAPTRVGSDTGWAYVSRASSLGDGNTHTLALKTDGSLFGWGSNYPDGQLGLPLYDGNGNLLATAQANALRLSPTRLQSPASFLAVGAGDGFSAVIRSDGFLLTAGRNDQGQLANGSIDTTPETGQDFFGSFDFSSLDFVDLSLQNLVIDENPAFPGDDPTLNLTANGELFLSLDLANLGTTDLNQDFDLGVSLSPSSSPSFDGSESIALNFIGNNRVTSNLGPSDSVSAGFRVQLPASITPGEYVLIVRGDAQSPRELSENPGDLDNNDIVSQPLSFLPDLSATVEVVTPTLTRGDPVDSILTIENIGSWSSTNPFQITAVLSPTPSFDSLDAISLPATSGGTVSGVIDPGASINAFVSVDIPIGLADGCYFLIYRIDAAGLVGEVEMANNDAASAGQTCFGAGFADVQARNLSLLPDPLNPSVDPATNLIAGGQLAVSVELVNNGDEVLAAGFELGAVLSPSGFYNDPNAVALSFIEGQTVSSAIAAGESLTVGARLKLPLILPAGQYDLVLRADSADIISESTEDNNDVAIEGLNFIPDIAMSFEILSSQINSPGTVQGIITLENIGSYTASVPFGMNAALVTTPFFDGLSPNPLGFVAFGPNTLNPGEVAQLPFTLALPAGLEGASGDCYYLAMRAAGFGFSGEQNLANNDFVSESICFGLEAADLVIDEVTAVEAPAFPGIDPLVNLRAGEPLTLSIDLSNSGDASITDDFELAAFLSPSEFTQDPRAIPLTFLDGETVTADITVMGAATVGARLQLPQTIESGVYNLIIVADSGENLTEVSRLNNQASLDALSFVPDIAISAEMNSDEDFASGSAVNVNLTIENVGSWTAVDDFQIEAVLGTTPFFDGLSSVPVTLTGASSMISADLDPNESIERAYTFSVPASFADNSYYLIFRADDARVLDETVLGNNDTVADELFDVGVDLSISSVNVAELTPALGSTLNASVFVENLGTRDLTEDFDVVAYLSPTQDASDPAAERVDLVQSGINVPSINVSTDLDASDSLALSLTVQLPASLDQGAYFLVFCLDDAAAIAELNESNNCNSTENTFDFVPDLVVPTGGFTLINDPGDGVYDPNTPDSFDILLQIENIGNGTLPAGTEFAVRLLLSPTQSEANSAAIDLSRAETVALAAPLAPGESLPLSYSYPVPGMPAGSFFVGAVIDVNDQIAEQQEVRDGGGLILQPDGEANNTAFLTSVAVNGLSLKNALDQGASALTFPTVGDGDWFGQSVTTNDGADAAQSPSLLAGQSASFSTLFPTPVVLTFDWRAETSNAANRGFFRVINGTNVTANNQIAGQTDGWIVNVTRVVPINARAQWGYEQGTDGDSDRVFVDNLRVTQMTAPDLIIDQISIPAGVAPEGGFVIGRDDLELTINSRNQGTDAGISDDYVISIYLSRDRVFNRPDPSAPTEGDILIEQLEVTEPIFAGSPAINGETISLPSSLPAGEYYVIGYIDDYTDESGNLLPGKLAGTGEISEFTGLVGSGANFPGEDNNLFISDNAVVQIATLPDLTVSDLLATPNFFYLRDPSTGLANSLPFNFRLSNSGLAPVLEPIQLEAFLSSDESYEQGVDFSLLSFQYDGNLDPITGAPANSQLISPDAVDYTNALIDAGLIGQRLFLGVSADVGNAIAEQSETNNADLFTTESFILSERPLLDALDISPSMVSDLNITVQNDEFAPFDSNLVPWVGQTSLAFDQVDAAASVRIGNNETSSFSIDVNPENGVRISFRWFVSSQNNLQGRDVLRFEVNGTAAVPDIFGTDVEGWQEVSLVLPAGAQTLTWSYIKDGQGRDGFDRGWVDQLAITELPDIEVTAISNNSAPFYQAGHSINSWSVDIVNNGLAIPAGRSFEIEVRLLENPLWVENGSAVLGTITDTDGLGAGESRTYDASDEPLLLPNVDYRQEFYYFAAYVDWLAADANNGQIVESREDNNSNVPRDPTEPTEPIEPSIRIGRPDLVASSNPVRDIDPTGYAFGDRVDLNLEFQNSGLGALAAGSTFEVSLYVSTSNEDDALERSSTVLLGNTTVTQLGSVEAGDLLNLATFSELLPYGLGFSTDDYYIAVVIDSESDIREQGLSPSGAGVDGEANNLFFTSTKVFKVNATTLQDALDDGNSTLSLGMFENKPEGAASWFGRDNVGDDTGDDDQSFAEGEGVQSPKLKVGEFASFTLEVDSSSVVYFDWGVLSGDPRNYLSILVNDLEVDRISGDEALSDYVGGILVPANSVVEWRYTKGVNNTGDFAVVDNVRLETNIFPDLRLSSLDYTPGEYVLDVIGFVGAPNQLLGTEFFDITVEATNYGQNLPNGTTFSSADIEILLSADDEYGNEDDIALGTVSQVEGSFDSGDELRFIGPIQLGDSIPEGSYYVIARIDSNDRVTEFNEDNNIVVSDNRDVEIRRLPALRILNSAVTTEGVDGSNSYLDPTENGIDYSFDIDEGMTYYPEGSMRLRFAVQNTGLGDIAGNVRWTTEVNLRGIKRVDLAVATSAEDFIGSVDPSINLGAYTTQRLLRGRSAARPDGDIVNFDIELALPGAGRLNSIIDRPEFGITDYLWFIEVLLDPNNVVQQSQIVVESPDLDLVTPTGIPWWIVDVQEALRAGSSNVVGSIDFNSDEAEGLFGISAPSRLMNASIWESIYPGFSTSVPENLLSYAFNRNPIDSDTDPLIGASPVIDGFPGTYGVSVIDGQDTFTVTFDIVTRAQDLTYRVLAADTLPIVPSSPGYTQLVSISGPFNQLVGPDSLTGDNGLISDPNVVSVIDQGYTARVTVKDNLPFGGSSRFFQVDVLSDLDAFSINALGAGVTANNGAYDDLDLDGVFNIFEILLGGDPDDAAITPAPTPTEMTVALQMFYFGVTSPGDNGPLDDADGDGQSNLLELLGGSNPNNTASLATYSPEVAYTLERLIVVYGSNLTNVGNQPENDLDGDGESNLAELQWGSDPNDSGDFSGRTAIELFSAESMGRFGLLNGIAGVTSADFDPFGDYDSDLESNIVELQLNSDPGDALILTGQNEVERNVADDMAGFGVFNRVGGVTVGSLAAGFDFDEGGATNLEELVFGTDPSLAIDDPTVTAIDTFVDDFIDTNYAPGNYAPAGDEDGDGFTNIEEIYLGTNPLL